MKKTNGREEISTTEVDMLIRYAYGDKRGQMARNLRMSIANVDYHTRRLRLFFHRHSAVSMVVIAIAGGILTQQWPPEATGQLFLNPDIDLDSAE